MTTGIILRRKNKTFFTDSPPEFGEIVFAIDTNEHGWKHTNGSIIWKVFNTSTSGEDAPTDSGIVGDTYLQYGVSPTQTVIQNTIHFAEDGGMIYLAEDNGFTGDHSGSMDYPNDNILFILVDNDGTEIDPNWIFWFYCRTPILGSFMMGGVEFIFTVEHWGSLMGEVSVLSADPSELYAELFVMNDDQKAVCAAISDTQETTIETVSTVFTPNKLWVYGDEGWEYLYKEVFVKSPPTDESTTNDPVGTFYIQY